MYFNSLIKKLSLRGTKQSQGGIAIMQVLYAYLPNIVRDCFMHRNDKIIKLRAF